MFLSYLTLKTSCSSHTFFSSFLHFALVEETFIINPFNFDCSVLEYVVCFCILCLKQGCTTYGPLANFGPRLKIWSQWLTYLSQWVVTEIGLIDVAATSKLRRSNVTVTSQQRHSYVAATSIGASWSHSVRSYLRYCDVTMPYDHVLTLTRCFVPRHYPFSFFGLLTWKGCASLV